MLGDSFILNLKQNKWFFLTGLLYFLVIFYLSFVKEIFEFLQPDSTGYIHFSTCRTIGYPTFLWICENVFGSLKFASFLQIIIYSYSAVFLSINASKLLNNKFLGYFVLLSLFLNPEWNLYHYCILTESLSSSLLNFLLGILCLYFTNQKDKYLIFSSIIVGLLILIRPVNYSYVSVFLIFGLFIFYKKQGNYLTKLSKIISPLVLLVFLGSFGFYLKHGTFRTQSFLGLNLIGKVGIFVNDDTKTTEPEFMNHFKTKMKPYQEVIKNVDSWQNYYFIMSPIYDLIRFTHLGGINKLGFATDDKFLLDRSIEILKTNPNKYLIDVVHNLSALWLMFNLQTKQELELFKNAIKYIKDYKELRSFIAPDFFVNFFRITFGILFLISFGMIFYPLLKLKTNINPYFFVASASAILIHSNYLLVAMVQAGLPRYAMACWSCLFVVVAISIYIICQWLKSKFGLKEKS